MAHYGDDRGSGQVGQSVSSRQRQARQYGSDVRSRWDNSPDNLPLGASAQSVMLSQTSWGEEPAQTPLLPGMQVHHDLPDHRTTSTICNNWRRVVRFNTKSFADSSNIEAYMSSNNLRFALNPPVSISNIYDRYRSLFPRDSQ